MTIEFGDFGQWFQLDNTPVQSWAIADCGCLVGSLALTALTHKPLVRKTLLPTTPANSIFCRAVSNLYGREAVAVLDDPVGIFAYSSRVYAVGMYMSEESRNRGKTSRAQRHHELTMYVRDFLWTTLTLMGHKKLRYVPDLVMWT